MRPALVALGLLCSLFAAGLMPLGDGFAADGPNLVAEKWNDAPASGVSPGGSFTWRIALRNVGNQQAQITAAASSPRTLLRDALPDGAGYATPQLTYEKGATATGLTCGITNRQLLCSVSSGTVTIPSGGAVVVAFRVTVSPTFGGSQLVNPSSPNQCLVDERPNIPGG